MRLIPFVALSGCPFLFAPPDFSNVDRGGDADADTDADSDTDADTDADSDTDTDTDDGSPPEFLDATVSPRVDSVVISFAATDPDLDFAGGHLQVTSDSGTLEFAIPNEIPGFDANGVNRLTLPRSNWLDCAPGVRSESFEVVLVDAGGHPSEPAELAFDLYSAGTLAEFGDALFNAARPFDAVSPPFLVCVGYEGDVYLPGNDLVEMRNDFETVAFDLLAGDYHAELQWGEAVTYDITMYDPGVTLFAYSVGGAPAPGTNTLAFNVPSAGRYAVDPRFIGWAVPLVPPESTLLVLITPD